MLGVRVEEARALKITTDFFDYPELDHFEASSAREGGKPWSSSSSEMSVDLLGGNVFVEINDGERSSIGFSKDGLAGLIERLQTLHSKM